MFTGAACTVDDAEFPGFGCMVDDRPVDGSLVELRVAPEPYPSYDYGATVRTAGRRLDGREYETTEAFEGLILR